MGSFERGGEMKTKADEIDNLYSSFFDRCRKTNCCGQSNLSLKYENHLYNHALMITENYFRTKHKILLIGQEKREESNDNVKIYTYDQQHVAGRGRNHWRETIRTVLKFQNDIANSEILGLSIYKFSKYSSNCEFAFTNYYKCAFSTNGDFSKDLIHTEEMKHNCKNCLKKEIEILEPDLIIMQGIELPDIMDTFKSCDILMEGQEPIENCKMYKCKTAKNRVIYLVRTYHPASSYHYKDYMNLLFNMIDKYKEQR